MDFLNSVTYYFIKINVTNIKERDFPVLSQKKEGKTVYDNSLGEYYVDKYTLEDAIEF